MRSATLALLIAIAPAAAQQAGPVRTAAGTSDIFGPARSMTVTELASAGCNAVKTQPTVAGPALAWIDCRTKADRQHFVCHFTSGTLEAINPHTCSALRLP